MDDWEREQIIQEKAWDDDGDVADSWDAEEEEEEVVVKEVKEIKQVKEVKQVKPVTTTTTAPSNNESAQERKERMERAVKESDLVNAMALFGIAKEDVNVDEVLETGKVASKSVKAPTPTPTQSTSSAFDNANPQNWTEFEALSTLISKKLLTLQGSKHYPNFLEHLFRALLADREVPEIRKLANMANEAAQVKQREKLNAGKKKAPSLMGAGKRADVMDFGGDDYDDPF